MGGSQYGDMKSVLFGLSWFAINILGGCQKPTLVFFRSIFINADLFFSFLENYHCGWSSWASSFAGFTTKPLLLVFKSLHLLLDIGWRMRLELVITRISWLLLEEQVHISNSAMSSGIKKYLMGRSERKQFFPWIWFLTQVRSAESNLMCFY